MMQLERGLGKRLFWAAAGSGIAYLTLRAIRRQQAMPRSKAVIHHSIMVNRPFDAIDATAIEPLLGVWRAARVEVSPVPGSTRSLIELTVQPSHVAPRAWLEHQLGEALRQFKSTLEAGEVATTEGQSTGARSRSGLATLTMLKAARRRLDEGRHVPRQAARLGGDRSGSQAPEPERHRR